MNTITAVKERPILFSTPMVIAINDNRKDITRRTKGLESINTDPDGWNIIHVGVYKARTNKGKINERFGVLFQHKEDLREVVGIPCPYGKPGDILWVRETWARVTVVNSTTFESHSEYRYKADHKGAIIKGHDRFKPSIHMPKEACRLRLEIKSIGAERLQDITEDDAKREGAPMYVPGHGIITRADLQAEPGYSNFLNYRMGFETLWTSINGRESRDANPWIWRIEFERLSETVNLK